MVLEQNPSLTPESESPNAKTRKQILELEQVQASGGVSVLRFVKVIKPQPTHTMRVLRCEGAHVDAPKAAAEDAKHGKHKPATRPRTRGWFTRRHAPPASSPFGISAAKAPVWFGGLVETGSKGALHD